MVSDQVTTQAVPVGWLGDYPCQSGWLWFWTGAHRACLVVHVRSLRPGAVQGTHWCHRIRPGVLAVCRASCADAVMNHTQGTANGTPSPAHLNRKLWAEVAYWLGVVMIAAAALTAFGIGIAVGAFIPLPFSLAAMLNPSRFSIALGARPLGHVVHGAVLHPQLSEIRRCQWVQHQLLDPDKWRQSHSSSSAGRWSFSDW